MPSRPRGYTLIDLLFAVTLAVILAGIAIPKVTAGLNRYRAWAAARYLAARMAMARSYAVTRSATVALRFIRGPSDVVFQMFVDDNHNGVRTLDIASHIDQPIGTAVRLSELFPGVVIGIGDGLGSDPLRIGTTNLVSFTPLGTATPGTIYVRGRNAPQLVVRITGPTGRTRVLRYSPRTREWIETF